VQTLTWAQACSRRLSRHHLLTPAHDAATVAGDVCGIHAQVMGAAEVSMGLRLAGATRADVRGALWTDRTLVKTYGPRGTVHLLPARELPLWTAALTAAPLHRPKPPPALRMTDEQIESIIEAIGAALAGGDPLTLDELDAAVIARTGAWAGERVMPAFTGMWPRWRWLISQAGHRGVLCFGPQRGRLVTYTSPARWLPDLPPAPADPLGEIVPRFLRAYGPATPAQFAQWLGANRPAIAAEFTRLADRLRPVDLDGEAAWLAADDEGEPAPSATAGSVLLLPHFDVYGVGAHPRPKVFPGEAATRALSGGQAGTVPVLVIDGVVAGVWHHKRSGSRIDLTVEPFGRLTAARRRALEAQAERIGEILEARPILTLGEVTARAHL
jgi:hypothetical protein